MPSAGSERPGLAFGRRERSGEAPIRSLALSPDGSLVAALTLEGRLIVWPTDRGGEVWRTRVPNDDPSGHAHVAFLTNREVAMHAGGAIARTELWSERADPPSSLPAGAMVASSRDTLLVGAGRYLAVLRPVGGSMRVLDVDWDGTADASLPRGRIPELAIALAPGARRGAALVRVGGESRGLVSIDVAAGLAGPVVPLPAALAGSGSGGLVCLDDGRIVLFGEGACLLDGATGAVVRRFEDAGTRTRELVAAVLAPDGGLIGAGRFGGVRWDVESGAVRTENRALTASVGSLALCADRGILAAPQHNAVTLFSATTLQRLGGAAAHGGEVTSVVMCPRGRRVFSSDGHTVRAWQAQTAESLWSTDGDLLGVSRDGAGVVAAVIERGEATRLTLLDATSGGCVEPTETAVCAVSFRDDGTMLAAGRVQRPQEGGRLVLFEGTELRAVGETVDIAVRPHAGLATFVPAGSAVLVHHLLTGEDGDVTQTSCFEFPSGAWRWTVNGGFPVVSPDGAFVALTSYANQGIQIFNLNGEERGSISLETWRVIAWGPGDLLLAVSTGKDPRVLRPDRRQFESFAHVDPPWLELEGGRSLAKAGAFFPDGSSVVMGEEGGTLRLWRVDTF